MDWVSAMHHKTPPPLLDGGGPQVKEIFGSVLSALAYCHANGVVHRDVKHDNVMFGDAGSIGSVRLVDFGCSQDAAVGESELLGTPGYIAPEVLPKPHTYTPACDLFAIGVMLYEIATCEHPYFREPNFSNEQYYKRVSTKDFRTKPLEGFDEDFKDLISVLLKRSPQQRVSAALARTHAWLARDAVALNGSATAKIAESALTNARSYQRMSKFEKAVLTQIAQDSANDEVHDLQELFKKLDANGDGTLTQEELINGFAQLGDSAKGSIDLSVLAAMDTGETGIVSYTEFLAACLDCRKFAHEEALRGAFDFFDFDNSGTIDREELVNIIGEEETQAVFASLGDKDSIDFEGFAEVVRRLSKKQQANEEAKSRWADLRKSRYELARSGSLVRRKPSKAENAVVSHVSNIF
jgi:calcium-dependent protein kinase